MHDAYLGNKFKIIFQKLRTNIFRKIGEILIRIKEKQNLVQL